MRWINRFKYKEIFKKKINKKTYPKKILNELIKNGENINNSQILRKKLIHEFFNNKNIPIHFVDHHITHAIYSFITAPKKLDKTLAFTADSMGDRGENSAVYLIKSGKIHKIFSSGKQNLGKLFRNITLLLGLKPYQHEYKVMGLAPYSPEFFNNQVVKIFRRYMSGFKKNWIFNKKPKDHYFLFQKELKGYRFDSIAGGLQAYFEEMLSEWFMYFVKKYKNIFNNIIFSGGLSMNVKANLKIQQIAKKYNKFFFAAPSADDYAHCIGAIYTVKNQIYDYPLESNQIKNLNLGYEFSLSDEKRMIIWAKKNKWKISKYNHLKASKLLAQDKILGLCHGSAEFGARSLGFRSIIADPSKQGNLKKINTQIKSRDFWMPFAPAIMSGKENLYLVDCDKDNSLFMACCNNTKEHKREHILAGIHPYDYTARPQIVRKNLNKKFYEIIKSFGKITGRYALLNTSLNLHGYPIVNNSSDLIYLLENSQLDGCILENYIILR